MRAGKNPAGGGVGWWCGSKSVWGRAFWKVQKAEAKAAKC